MQTKSKSTEFLRKPVGDNVTGLEGNIVENMIILIDNVVYREYIIENDVWKNSGFNDCFMEHSRTKDKHKDNAILL